MEKKDNKLNLARDWYKAKEKLDEAKKHEKVLRDELIEAYSFNTDKSGTQKKDMTDTHRLSLNVPKKFTVDKELFFGKKGQLEAKGLIGDGKLFTLEPKLNAKAYGYLTDEDSKIVVDMIEEGVGSPSLKTELIK